MLLLGVVCFILYFLKLSNISGSLVFWIISEKVGLYTHTRTHTHTNTQPQFTIPKESQIFTLNKELFMRSENTREFTAERNDHSLWFISEIQFDTISLIENHNQHP